MTDVVYEFEGTLYTRYSNCFLYQIFQILIPLFNFWYFCLFLFWYRSGNLIEGNPGAASGDETVSKNNYKKITEKEDHVLMVKPMFLC